MSLKFRKNLAIVTMVTVSNVSKSNEITCNGNRNELFHDGGRANQWTGFYMITASVMKELRTIFLVREIYFCAVVCRKNVSANEPVYLLISEYRLKLGKTNVVLNIMVWIINRLISSLEDSYFRVGKVLWKDSVKVGRLFYFYYQHLKPSAFRLQDLNSWERKTWLFWMKLCISDRDLPRCQHRMVIVYIKDVISCGTELCLFSMN